jgi:hypothetical protein
MTDGNGEPADPIAKRLSSIEREVGKLRVLAEENESRIKLIAEGHGAKLDSHSATLDAHTATLDAHSATLDAHSAKLDAHSAILASHSAVLASHGRKLDEIISALEPLPQIRDFIERVAVEHDRRLTDLEKRVGIPE